MTKKLQQILTFIFGVSIVVVLLVLAVVIPNPTPFQYTVFRVVLALAAAGVAAIIPGFFQVNVAAWLRAGGALGILALVYFYNPAELFSEERDLNTDKKENEMSFTESKIMASDFIFEFSADDWVIVKGRVRQLRIPFAEHKVNDADVTVQQKEENGNWQNVDCDIEADEFNNVIVSIGTDGFDGRVLLK